MSKYQASRTNEEQQRGVPTAKPVNGNWLQISKNFSAYPVAFPPRARAVFKRTPDRDFRCWGSANIALRIAPDSPREHRRGPSGFDMKFLYWVLSMRLMRIENRLSMSRKEILEHMGEECSRTNYLNLARALDYWQHMGMEFDRFYVPDGKKLMSGSYISATLGPPIIVWADGTIVANDDWDIVVPRKYFKRLPRSLPTDAYVQRLVLVVADGRTKTTRKFKSKRELTRLLGIDHDKRNIVLDRVIEDAQDWFQEHDGELTCASDRDGSLTLAGFLKELPKLTRTKKILAEKKERDKEYKERWGS